MIRYITNQNKIIYIMPAHSWTVESFLACIGCEDCITSSNLVYEEADRDISGSGNLVDVIWTTKNFERMYESINDDKYKKELNGILKKLIYYDTPLNCKSSRKLGHLIGSEYRDIHINNGDKILQYAHIGHLINDENDLILDLGNLLNHDRLDCVIDLLDGRDDEAIKAKISSRKREEYKHTIENEDLVRRLLHRSLEKLDIKSNNELLVSIKTSIPTIPLYSEFVKLSNIENLIFDNAYITYKRQLVGNSIDIDIDIEDVNSETIWTLNFPKVVAQTDHVPNVGAAGVSQAE